MVPPNAPPPVTTIPASVPWNSQSITYLVSLIVLLLLLAVFVYCVWVTNADLARKVSTVDFKFEAVRTFAEKEGKLADQKVADIEKVCDSKHARAEQKVDDIATVCNTKHELQDKRQELFEKKIDHLQADVSRLRNDFDAHASNQSLMLKTILERLNNLAPNTSQP